MPEIWLKRVGNALVGADTESNSAIAKLAFGKLLRAEIKTPRSGPQNRLFWALCSRIAEAIGSTSENVSDVLKIASGHCEVIRSKTYGELKLPRSISFAKMDQTAFNEFFNRCIHVIETEWGVARPDILGAVEDLLTPAEWKELGAVRVPTRREPEKAGT